MKRISLAALASVIVGALVLILLIGSRALAGGGSAVKALPGCTDHSLIATDDGSTPQVALPFSISIFGTTYSGLYVNNNGNVTLDAPLAGIRPDGLLAAARVIIAPFFADVDTRGPGSGQAQYGATTFGGRPAFCVNWVNVGYYNSRTDKLNSFQLLLVDRPDVAAGDFDIVFNYEQIQWETGDANDGEGGLGGASVRVGFSDGVSEAFELPGSGTPGSFLDLSPGGLIHSSRDSVQSGRYVFPVRGSNPIPPTPTPSPTATLPATPTSTRANTPTPTRTPPGPAAGSGDANCDGVVGAIDAAFVLQFGAGLLDELPCGAAADVNQDGRIDAVDAVLTLQFTAGLLDELPV